MAFYAPAPTASDSDYELAPEGTHVARCYQVIDLGVQPSELYGDKHKVRIAWELCDEMREGDGKPFSVSKNYTLSLHEKAALRKDLEAWRGKAFAPDEIAAFDLEKLAGLACMVTVQHRKSADGTRTYANVVAVSALPKRMTAPDGVNPLLVFNLTDRANEDLLPPWLQAKINFGGAAPKAAPARQPEPRRAPPPANQKLGVFNADEAVTADADMDDDIPF